METIGPLQLRVMHFLWRQGPATVHVVLDHINLTSGTAPLAYTTVLTVMRNLSRRHFLSQQPQGRSHLFTPLVNETSYKQGMLRQMRKDLFAGEVAGLLQFLCDDDEIDANKREHIAHAIRALAQIQTHG